MSNSLESKYDKRAREFTKQLRSSSLPRNLLPLYDPEPMSRSEFDEVNVGDVVIIIQGRIKRLFSVVVADRGKYNNTRRGVPEELEPLKFSPEKDLKRASLFQPGDVWCGPKLSCKKLDSASSPECVAYCVIIIEAHMNQEFVLPVPEDEQLGSLVRAHFNAGSRGDLCQRGSTRLLEGPYGEQFQALGELRRTEYDA